MGKGAATRERILDTAFRLGARDGLGGLSLASLASQLGVSKSGLFAHFGSKEELQLATLQAASERFTQAVLLPAFRRPRGLPRVKALFDNWIRWFTDPSLPGGCVFLAAAGELDDKPGAVRDYLVSTQERFLAALARSARIAVEEGHFRSDLDCEQFAFELHALFTGFHFNSRLLREPKAERRVRTGFQRLLETSTSRS